MNDGLRSQELLDCFCDLEDFAFFGSHWLSYHEILRCQSVYNKRTKYC